METPTNAGNAAGASGAFGSDSTHAGPTAGFDPVLISLIRRSMPNLVAYDLAGVQPMSWSYWTDLRNAFSLRWSLEPQVKTAPKHSSMKQIPPSLVRIILT